MKILITGANGLLGQKLVSLYAEKNESDVLLVTARSPLTFAFSGAFELMDVTDKHAILNVFEKHKPDVVIHTAAMTQVDDCETQRDACRLNNVTAVHYLTEACTWYDSHFIHVSTDFIFDGTEGPLPEDATPNPVNYYGQSKWEAEKIVQATNLKWCILRTVLVYGITKDMSRSNIVLWVKQSLENGKKIKVVDDQWRTPTLAEDLAMGCYLAAAKKATGIYNISGKNFVTPYEIAIKTAQHFGLDVSLIEKTDGSQFKQVAKRPAKTGFIITKAEKELGYKPHSLQEGIALLGKQLEAGEN
jgi:dTDP-4-dehydrorhamnose reductase